jgi:hypothetical protein
MAGDVKDKWACISLTMLLFRVLANGMFQNHCPQYLMMLLAQTFRRLIMLWDAGGLPDLPHDLICNQVPLVLLQILHRTLHWQNWDGSWGENASYEGSAYAILTLVDASLFPWTEPLDAQVSIAISKGHKFLKQSREHWGEANYTWTEKVSYSSSVLSKTYCLASSKAATNYPTHYPWTPATSDLIGISRGKVSKFTKFFSQIPLFASEPEWKIHASLIEGYLFLPRLRRIRLDVFPRKDMAEDNYLEYIPFTWTGCNNKGAFLEADLLWDMMFISMLNYQADEFMETVVGTHFSYDQVPIQQLIQRLCAPQPDTTSCKFTLSENDAIFTFNSDRLLNGSAPTPPQSGYNSPTALTSIESTLRRFTTHVLQHPRILSASHSSQRHLAGHLCAFLLAHLTHCTDNALFATQLQPPSSTTPTFATDITYWDWVRTTSAVHTSCPYSWAWLTCRIAGASHHGKTQDPFPTVALKYWSQDMAAHLAAMYRMYNDHGSLARDKAEQNLNSMNFPEFENCGAVGGEAGQMGDGPERCDGKQEADGDVQARKAVLLELAEFERACVSAAKERLMPLVGKRVRDVIGVFVDVTDLYGQIYVARDIASRMR